MNATVRALIALLVKNAEPYLDQLLERIFSQDFDGQFQVAAIDSGSMDRTLEILERSGVRTLTIAPEEFNHGETRNMAARLAGEDVQYVVYLSQDAVPADEHWLSNLLWPMLEDPEVAGVFSRHIPREGASPSLVRQLTTRWQTGGTRRLVKELPGSLQEYEENKLFYVYFSNTSSAIRRKVLLAIPFAQVPFAEDAEWADRVLRAGYKLVFEPASRVIHSHDYGTIEQFRQNVDHTSAMVHLFALDHMRSPWIWLRSLASVPLEVWWDFRFMRRSPFHRDASIGRKIYWLLRSPLWHTASVLGGLTGANIEKVPEALRIHFLRQERLRRGK